jgi:hypothetical protein
MAEARTRESWNHTAAVLAILANAHRDPKKSRPFAPADFHPHARRRQKPRGTVGIMALKQVFIDRPAKGG